MLLKIYNLYHDMIGLGKVSIMAAEVREMSSSFCANNFRSTLLLKHNFGFGYHQQI